LIALAHAKVIAKFVEAIAPVAANDYIVSRFTGPHSFLPLLERVGSLLA
jgi:hypothetical protein